MIRKSGFMKSGIMRLQNRQYTEGTVFMAGDLL